MPEHLNIHQVTTEPKPFGVTVKWKWPDGSHWFSWLELQCLFEDGRLEREGIRWPVTGKLISGLKASERVQVRLRPVAADGSARDWRTDDWIEGISSVDTDEILQALQEDIRNSKTFEALRADKIINLSGRATDVLYALFFRGALQSSELPSKSGAAQLRDLGLAETRHTATAYGKVNHFTFLTAEGQAFAVKYLVDTCFGAPGVAGSVVVAGKLYSAGIGISIEGDQRKVVFEADRFKKHETAEPISSIASVTGTATRTRLSDEMQELVVKAVRESDLLTSLQTAIAAAQAASTFDLQQAVDDAVGKALYNAMRPGGAIWSAISHR